MPIAMLYLLEGRDRETKERVIREVTGALERSLGSPPEKIRVILQEIPSESWGVGGVLLAKKSSQRGGRNKERVERGDSLSKAPSAWGLDEESHGSPRRGPP